MSQDDSQSEDLDGHDANSKSRLSGVSPEDGPTKYDPFDPKSLRLTDSTSFGVEKVLTSVPVGKPNRHVFVRCHSEEQYRLDTALFEDKNTRETYIVGAALRDALSSELVPARLVTSITRHGDLFLWPVKLPGGDGRSNAWHESAAAAAELATKHWVRISANMLGGRYDVARATGAIPEPDWPELSFREILKLAFQHRVIDSIDHPVLKALRGEV